MKLDPAIFDQLDAAISGQGIDAALDQLEGHFRRQKEFFRLFEILKIKVRHRLGLLLVPAAASETLSDRQQRDLDDGLIDACEVVGTLLFRNGDFQHGWTYLQPVGNRKLTNALLREIKIDDDNVNGLIEIALGQGAAPEYGYELLVKSSGTCNAISAFEVQAEHFDRATQAAMAATLLNYVYEEVVAGVSQHIKREGETPRPDASLKELLVEHSWLVEQRAYHLDATHLASLMKIARVVTRRADIENALELAEYGVGFPQDFQYASLPPFEDTYPDHQIFYRGLLGDADDVDRTIELLNLKSQQFAADNYGPVADEALVDFCHRVGRIDQAIGYYLERLADRPDVSGLVPDLLSLAKTEEQFDRVLEHFRQRGDLLGYSRILLRKNEAQT